MLVAAGIAVRLIKQGFLSSQCERAWAASAKSEMQHLHAGLMIGSALEMTAPTHTLSSQSRRGSGVACRAPQE